MPFIEHAYRLVQSGFFYVYDKAQGHVGTFMWKHQKATSVHGDFPQYYIYSMQCKCESKHATRQLRSPARVYDLRTEIVEAKTHAG